MFSEGRKPDFEIRTSYEPPRTFLWGYEATQAYKDFTKRIGHENLAKVTRTTVVGGTHFPGLRLEVLKEGGFMLHTDNEIFDFIGHTSGETGAKHGRRSYAYSIWHYHQWALAPNGLVYGRSVISNNHPDKVFEPTPDVNTLKWSADPVGVNWGLYKERSTPVKDKDGQLVRVKDGRSCLAFDRFVDRRYADRLPGDYDARSYRLW